MASLTSTGVRFSDDSTLNSYYGIIPQNTYSIFFQASAPTGWTKSTSYDDYALRVVSGTGGGSGGSTAFSGIFPTEYRPVSQPGVPMSGSVGNHTLTTSELATHSHDTTAVTLTYTPGLGDVGYASGWTRSSVATSGTGGGGSHNHPWSGTCDFSGSFDMRIKYMNVILCSFD